MGEETKKSDIVIEKDELQALTTLENMLREILNKMGMLQLEFKMLEGSKNYYGALLKEKSDEISKKYNIPADKDWQVDPEGKIVVIYKLSDKQEGESNGN